METWQALNQKALELYPLGRFPEAIQLTLRAINIVLSEEGKETTSYATLAGNLGLYYQFQGEYEKALGLLSDSIRIWQDLGDPDPFTHALSLKHLGQTYVRMSKFQEGEILYQQALPMMEKTRGQENEEYASVLFDMGIMYLLSDQIDKAEEFYQKALNIREKVLGKNHGIYAQNLNYLAELYRRTNRLAEAVPLFQEAMDFYVSSIGKENPHYTTVAGNLAFTYFQMGRYKEAESLCEECLEAKAVVYGTDDYQYADTVKLKADIKLALNQTAEAEKLYQSFLTTTLKTLGPGHVYTISARLSLAELYLETHALEAAEAMFQAVLSLLQNSQQYAMLARTYNGLGMVYYHRQDFSEAEKAYQASLSYWGMIPGKELEIYYANALNNLGLLYTDLGRFVEATNLLTKSYQLKEKQLGPNHPSFLTTINNLAILKNKQGHFLEAVGYAETFYEKVQIHLAHNHLIILKAHNNLGEIYRSVGRFEEAENLLIEATLYEAEHPTQDRHFKHKIANNLGMVYLEKGDFSKAEEVFLGSYKQMTETLSESPMTLLMPLGNLASLYSEWGKFDEAESYYLKAWDFVTQYQLEDLAEAGFIAHNLGGLYVQKGQYTLANRYLRQANQLARKLGENHILFATSLNSLGFYHFTLGNYEKAEKFLFQAQQVERRFRSEFSMLNAQIQSNLGSLYSELGFAEKAERYFTGSLRIQEKIQGDKHPQRAQFLNNIGLHYTHFFQHQKALTHYLEAKKICENAFEDESPLLGSVLANLADNYRSTQHPEAEKLFLRTLTIAEKTKGKHHPDILNIKNNLAILYLDLGRLDESEKILKNLIETQKDIYKNHPEYAVAVSNLALVSLRAKHIKDAVYYGKKSWKLLLKNLTRLLPALAEKERQHYFQSFSGNIEFLKNLAIQTHREYPEMTGHLYDLLLATKAVLTDQAEVLRQRIFSVQDPALQNSFQNWREEREELISHYLGRKALSPSQLTEKEYHADQLEKALYQQSKRFVQIKNNRSVSWEDIKTALKPGEAAIEFFQYRPWGKGGFQQASYGALIIHPEQKDFPQLVIFPEHENWETQLASQYQGYIYSSQTETRGLFWENIAEWTENDVHHFFRNCWHPIHIALQKNSPVKKIYLSNAGVFHKINLETIFWPEKGMFLGDYYDFHLLTSTGKISETVHSSRQTDIKSGTRQAILIGGVDFENSAQETNQVPKTIPQRPSVHRGLHPRFSSGDELGPLPGTREEVEKIAETLRRKNWEVRTFVGNQAVEGVLYQFHKPTLIHIATHGYFESSEEPRLFLGIVKAHFSISHPMLKSGLFLAGAEQTLNQLNTRSGKETDNRQDGIFSAYEASHLDLREVELVVLSACETGLGNIKNGEGVSGLQNAFLIAGAKTLMISLWKVDDSATRDLMVAFYEFWLEHGDKRKAFKQAQQKIRENYPSPYYWGGFVLVGE